VVLPWGASSEASYRAALAAYLVVSDPWGAFPWEGNAACLGVPSERQQRVSKISVKPTTQNPPKSVCNKEMLNIELKMNLGNFRLILQNRKQHHSLF